MNSMTDLLRRCLDEGSLISLVLGSKRKKSQPLNKVTVRPVSLREGMMYQAEYSYEKKALHENLDPDELCRLFEEMMRLYFKQANLFTTQADYQILASHPDRPRIQKKSPTKKMPSLSHNKAKHYLIPDGIPCPFLVRLGVMNQQGQVLKKHYGKFRQINRFLEITADVLDHLPGDRTLKIVDFGCGKAYLTFALYHFLKIQLGRDVQITGLDLKEDVVDFCNQVAMELGYESLHFEVGDIAMYEGKSADMVVTLHACDTATDFALLHAHSWQASVILSVPCCQHELFPQLQNELHAPLLSQGILRERFSAILTDTFRMLKLESWGYDVSMIEFTSLEHTAKNIMIRAVYSGRPNPQKEEQCRRLADYWHADPAILRERVT